MSDPNEITLGQAKAWRMDLDRISKENAELRRCLDGGVDCAAERTVLKTALRDLYEFYAANDTREGHAKRCNRWKGLGCTCGGTRVRDAAKLALGTQSDRPGVEHE
jgi:hypothetical protein